MKYSTVLTTQIILCGHNCAERRELGDDFQFTLPILSIYILPLIP